MASTRFAELQHTFVAPRPLTQSRPRDVQLTGAGRALAVFAIVLFAAAVAAGVLISREAARQAADRRALAASSATVTGEVTRLWSNGDERRRVEYRFVVDGRPVTSRVRVSDQIRRTLQVGSPLTVRYVLSNPRLNDLGGPVRGGLPEWLAVVTAAALAAVGGLCFIAIRRQHQLLSDGRVAPAIVTAHHQQRSQHGTHRSLSFEFPLLSGAVVSGKSASSSRPPAIGSVICVVYDPDRPKRNRIYPLKLVKPAA